jgi:hypothetical protein
MVADDREISCRLLAPPTSLIWSSFLNEVSLRIVKQAVRQRIGLITWTL